jgi:hypothetical protein
VALSEGERARAEALHRDRRALDARFARWFPAPRARDDADAALPELAGGSPGDADAVVAALASVAEVVSIVGGSDLARRADAIEMLERLLPDAGLSPARYEAVLAEPIASVARALAAVHDAVRVGGGGRGRATR